MICPLCGLTTERARRWARLRFALGMLQMAAAVTALALTIHLGVAAASLIAISLACASSALGVFLFGGRRAAVDS